MRTKANAYGILFEFPQSAEIDLNKMSLLFKQVGGDKAKQILDAVLPKTSLFAVKFSHVAKRFGLIRKDADYRQVGLKKIIRALPPESPVLREVLNELQAEKLDVLGAVNVLADLAFEKIKIKLIESGG